MNQDQRVSREVIEQKLSQGAAVMDATGETIGTVANYDMQGGYMVVSSDMLFSDETRIPLDAIGDTGASGIYLNSPKDELLRQYGQDGGSSGQIGATTTTATTPGAQDMGPATAVDRSAEATSGVAATTDTTQGVAAATAGTMQGAAARPAPQANVAERSASAGTGEDVRIPVAEEELVVDKQQAQIGDVHLHTDVVTEQETVPVNLRREEVTVERVPVDQAADPASTKGAFKGEDIDVPVMGEEAVVGKQVRETEEVRLRKQSVTEQQQVTDTVRKERVTVDGQGVDTSGDTSAIDAADRTRGV